MENTKKNNGKEWTIWYTLSDDDYKYNPVVVKIVKFQANTYDEMLKKALKILKRSAKRVRRLRSRYFVNIFPEPLPGEEAGDGSEIFGLKSKYSDTQKILKLKEKGVQKYFVKGCGPDALKQRFE